MEITIRPIALKDAAQVAILSAQFGYPNSTEIVETRIAKLQSSQVDFGWIAWIDEMPCGWIQVTKMLRLESGEFAEITGLVVAEPLRGHGVGKLLVQNAQAWARNLPLGRLVVRSNIVRDGAHAFYLHLGFKNMKQQMVYEIDT